MKRAIRHTLRPLCVVLAGVFCTVALAQDPATDGLTWVKGYPKGLEIPTKMGFHWVTAAGKLDTTKYPNIKLDSDTAFMEVAQLDKDGKDVPGTKKTFKSGPNDLDKDKGTWQVPGLKEWVNGKEELFGGYPAGKYRVKVVTKVKEKADSAARDAIIQTTIDVPTPPQQEDEDELLELPLHRLVVGRKERRNGISH